MHPLNSLLKKFTHNKPNLYPDLYKRIDELKDLLVNAPILTLADILSNTSDTGLGAMLL